MRLLLLAVALGFLPFSALAQRLPAGQLPAPVLRAFARAQPQATHVVWHRCPAGYEAAFAQRPADYVVGARPLWGLLTLSPPGEVIETRLDITYRDFPPLGRTAVSRLYPGRELDRITRVVNATGQVSYEVKVCKGKDKKGKDKDCQTCRFDENGRPPADPGT